MVDTILMNNLLWALPNEAHLIIVGDLNQLASVGTGRVLYDLTLQLNHGKHFKNLDIERPYWLHLTGVQRTSLQTKLPFDSKSLLTKDKKERWINFEKEFDESVKVGSIKHIDIGNVLSNTCKVFLENKNAVILTPRHHGGDGGRIDINNEIMSRFRSGYSYSTYMDNQW